MKNEWIINFEECKNKSLKNEWRLITGKENINRITFNNIQKHLMNLGSNIGNDHRYYWRCLVHSNPLKKWLGGNRCNFDFVFQAFSQPSWDSLCRYYIVLVLADFVKSKNFKNQYWKKKCSPVICGPGSVQRGAPLSRLYWGKINEGIY